MILREILKILGDNSAKKHFYLPKSLKIHQKSQNQQNQFNQFNPEQDNFSRLRKCFSRSDHYFSLLCRSFAQNNCS